MICYFKRFVIIILFCWANTKTEAQLSELAFNSDTLKYWVSLLANDSLKGRYSGSKESIVAAQIIANEFKRAGLKPLQGNDGYLMSLEKYGYNVVGGLQGRSFPGQVVIFCAHYDHIGTYSTNPYKFLQKDALKTGDTIYNGANDNASGISALIALANYFGSMQTVERTVFFIAFSGEELGLIGSRHMADFFMPDSVKAVINIEMIGRSYLSESRPYLTGSGLSDLYFLMNKRLFKNNKTLYGRNYFREDPFIESKLFIRSDNYPFALKKIPAHTIMATSPEDQYYHSPGDEISTLDFQLMSQIVKAIAISCEGLVEGTETPRRIR